MTRNLGRKIETPAITGFFPVLLSLLSGLSPFHAARDCECHSAMIGSVRSSHLTRTWRSHIFANFIHLPFRHMPALLSCSPRLLLDDGCSTAKTTPVAQDAALSASACHCSGNSACPCPFQIVVQQLSLKVTVKRCRADDLKGKIVPSSAISASLGSRIVGFCGCYCLIASAGNVAGLGPAGPLQPIASNRFAAGSADTAILSLAAFAGACGQLARPLRNR